MLWPATGQTYQPEREAAPFKDRALQAGTVRDPNPPARAGRFVSGPEGVSGLIAGSRAVSRQMQALTEACERITQDPEAAQDVNLLRNVLHVGARLDAMVQAMTNALGIMERVPEEQGAAPPPDSSREARVFP